MEDYDKNNIEHVTLAPNSLFQNTKLSQNTTITVVLTQQKVHPINRLFEIESAGYCSVTLLIKRLFETKFRN